MRVVLLSVLLVLSCILAPGCEEPCLDCGNDFEDQATGLEGNEPSPVNGNYSPFGGESTTDTTFPGPEEGSGDTEGSGNNGGTNEAAIGSGDQYCKSLLQCIQD